MEWFEEVYMVHVVYVARVGMQQFRQELNMGRNTETKPTYI